MAIGRPIAEFTIELGKVDYLDSGRRDNAVEIEVRLHGHDGAGKFTVDLEYAPETYLSLAISGNVWNHIHTDIYTGGQCLDRLLELMPNNDLLLEIWEVWDRWHLNDLNAGTRRQAAQIEAYKEAFPDWRYDHTEAREILEGVGLYEDRGYPYGTAWLIELLPEEVVEQVLSWQYEEAS